MAPNFQVDARAVRFISIVSVIVAAVFSGCVYFAVQLRPAGLAWALTLLSAALGVLLVRHAVVTFRGSLGVVVGDEAIRAGSQTIPYTEVERVETLGFGHLRLHASNGRRVMVCTYMFEDREGLTAFLTERLPKP